MTTENKVSYSKQNAFAWDRQSKRYLAKATFRNDVLDFGDTRCLTDDDLNLVGDVNLKRILELGCGGANISINLAKRGGVVTAIDISEQQIDYAIEEAKREGVRLSFQVATIEDYRFRNDFDMVISICAFQYVDNLSRVFQNIYRHLVPGGALIFSTNHPAFYTAAYTTIWKEEKESTDYSDERPETWKWEHGDDFTFTSFPHPLEFYINELAACGFRIEKMHELRVLHTKVKNEEERLETVFPRYLVMKAVKPV